MAFPYTGSNSNAELVAEQIDSMVGAALAKTSAWRAAINGTSQIDSLQAQDVYQTLAAMMAYVSTRGGVDGLAEAYRRRFPSLSEAFNPATEWGAASTAIANFGSWFQANWPERTASNKPAFSQFSPTTGELIRFSINLSAPAKTSILALLDAVVAAFAAA